MSTGRVLRFWRGVPTTVEASSDDDLMAMPAPAANMEQLAKNIELARMNKVDCEAELLKAQGLLERCIDEYEAEVERRNLRSRK